MDEPGEIDFLVPYFSGAEYLAQTVRSVVAQRGVRWRLLVADDAGPDDDARRVVGACVPESVRSQVQVVRHAQRLGIASNFSFCVGAATAPVCVLLGADDVLGPHYAQVVLRALGRVPSAQFVQPGVRVIDAAGVVHLPLADRVKNLLRPVGHRVLAGESLAVSLLHGDWLYLPSLAWRTEALRQWSFDASLHTAMDLDVLVRMVCAGAELVVDPTVCFWYRRHAASASMVTAAAGSRFREERLVYARLAEVAAGRGWFRAECAARLRLTSRAHGAFIAVKQGAIQAKKWRIRV